MRSRFDRPIFLVSPPRSGSSLLFLTLAQAPDLFTVGGESHALIESVPGLHPAQRDWDSNRLVGADATEERAELLAARFHASLRDRAGRPPSGRVTMLEKTPKNSLRVPFLASVFPDARFLLLYRDPRETLSSMIEAWRTGRFVTYPRLPAWGTPAWSLLLVPGWQALIDAPLEQVVAAQWGTAVSVLLEDLAALPADRVRAVSLDRFLTAPEDTARAICAAVGLGWDRPLPTSLPLSPTVVSPPAPDKWRRHEAEIARIWASVAPIDRRAREALARYEVG